MKWIKFNEKKPEGEVFWGLTEGVCQEGHRDWVIRKFWNCSNGHYKTLDLLQVYHFPKTYDRQYCCVTIFAWCYLNEISPPDRNDI